MEPPRLYSHRGWLDVELVIEERECFWAGARRTAISYNGGVPGPTLVTDPGDGRRARERPPPPTVPARVIGVAVDAPSYRDTVTVHPRQSVTFRTVFADFTGRSFFHCHITPHSELGMMAVFEIVAPGGRPRPKPPGFLCRL